MTSMGIATIKFTEDEATNKGRYDKTKVKRYWAGSQPYWKKEESQQQQDLQQAEDDDYEQPQILRRNQSNNQNDVKNVFDMSDPVIVKKNEDPRLKRLQQEELEQQNQGQRIRQRIRGNNQFQNQVKDDEQNNVKEDPDEAIKNRDLVKQRALMQERMQEQIRSANKHDREDGEDSDSEGTDSEDEESSYLEESENEPEENENFSSKIKPIFRRKEERQVLPQAKQEYEDEEEDPKVVEQRKKEQSQHIMREIQNAESEAARIDNENKQQFAPEDVNTDNENDEEQEFEAWKQRELNRVKMERLDLNKELKEKLDKDNDQSNKKNKKRWNFLQKYYHKGAFFQDDPDDIRGTTGREEIFGRDYSAPTGEDAMDKSKLPQVMQVRNFGRSGRTKWTHLVNEDTTQWESPWVNREAYDKMFKRLQGTKGDLEVPRKKFKQDFGLNQR